MDSLGKLVRVEILVLISCLSELLWFPIFGISSSKIISKKGFCFRIDKISTSLVECERVEAKIGKALRADGSP